MPKRRKNHPKVLSTKPCKKRKTANFREIRENINYDGSAYDSLDNLDDSEIIEISSDDKSEVAIVDCVNPMRFTDMAQKGQDMLDEAVNNLEKQSDNEASRSGLSNHISSRNTISVSESETISSVQCSKRRNKSSKNKIKKPMIEEMFIVEQILAMRELNGVRQFLLKWEGFPDSENSWEPEENIDSKDIIMEYLVELERRESMHSMCDDVASNDKGNKSQQCENNYSAFNNENVKNISQKENRSNISENDRPTNRVVDENKLVKKAENIDKIKEKHKKKSSNNKRKTTSNKKINKTIITKESEIDLTMDEEECLDKESDRSAVTIKQSEQEIYDRENTLVNVADECQDPQNDGYVLMTETCNNDKDLLINEADNKSTAVNETEDVSKDETASSSDCVVIRSGSTQSNKDDCEGDDKVEQDEEESDEATDENDDQGSDGGGVASGTVSKPRSLAEDAKSNVTTESQKKSNTSEINANPFCPGNVPPDLQEIFQVEKILRMRWSGGMRYFYLKWEGFPDSENSWEPECNLECPELIEDFVNELKKPKTLQRKSDATSTAGSTKRTMYLEPLSDETKIKEPVPAIKPKGFPKEREAEVILASGIVNDELSFLIKWKNVDMANLVPARRANVECPQIVIRFYENNLRWQNSDGSVTILPHDRVTIDDEAVARELDHERLRRQDQRGRLEAAKNSTGRSSPSVFDQLLSSSVASMPVPPSVKVPVSRSTGHGRGRGRPLGSCRRRGHPVTSTVAAATASVQTTAGTIAKGSGSSRMLGIIKDFGARIVSKPGTGSLESRGGSGRRRWPEDRDDGPVTNIDDPVPSTRTTVYDAVAVAPVQGPGPDALSQARTNHRRKQSFVVGNHHRSPRPPQTPGPRSFQQLLQQTRNNGTAGRSPLSEHSSPLIGSLTQRQRQQQLLKEQPPPPPRSLVNSVVRQRIQCPIRRQNAIDHGAMAPQPQRQQNYGPVASYQDTPLSQIMMLNPDDFVLVQQSQGPPQSQSQSQTANSSIVQYQYIQPQQQLLGPQQAPAVASQQQQLQPTNSPLVQYQYLQQPVAQQQQQMTNTPIVQYQYVQQQVQQTSSAGPTEQQTTNSHMVQYVQQQQQQQQQQQVPATGQQATNPPIVQYQYVVNNSYQPMVTTSNNYVLASSNSNQIYYTTDDIVQALDQSPIQILPELSQDFSNNLNNQLPIMFDSQSRLQASQTNNNNIVNRNSYLNLGAYL